jgi:hypothetical protein
LVVKYVSIRKEGCDLFTPFSFIFYHKKGIVSNLIRLFTKGKYSHVAFLYDGIHIIQCDYKTPISIQHFSYPENSYDIFGLNITLSDVERRIVLNYIKINLSSKYDFLFILSRGLNILFGTRIISSPTRFNCDELIVEAFNQAGINLMETGVFLTPDSLSQSKYLKRIY